MVSGEPRKEGTSQALRTKRVINTGDELSHVEHSINHAACGQSRALSPSLPSRILSSGGGDHPFLFTADVASAV